MQEDRKTFQYKILYGFTYIEDMANGQRPFRSLCAQQTTSKMLHAVDIGLKAACSYYTSV